jgi:hypothetical protein
MMTQRGDPAAGVIAETPESTNRRSRLQNHGRCRGRGHRLQTSPFIRVDSCPSVVSPSRSSSETPHGASIALEPRRVIRGSNSIGGLNPPPVTCDALRPSVRLAAKRPMRRIRGLNGKTGETWETRKTVAAPLRVRGGRAIRGYNPRSGSGEPSGMFSVMIRGGRPRLHQAPLIRVYPCLSVFIRG